MTPLVGVAAGLFLFFALIVSGWRAAGTHDQVDRSLTLIVRHNNDEAERC